MKSKNKKINKTRKKKCEDGTHQLTYAGTDTHKTTYVCIYCGSELYEYEDAGTGA